MKIVIAGGDGSLGRRIAADLREHDIVVLSRQPDPGSPVRQVAWDGEHVGDWAPELEGPGTTLINLAGKLVDCRPSRRNIAELTRSRVLPTQALVQASRQRRRGISEQPRLDSGATHIADLYAANGLTFHVDDTDAPVLTSFAYVTATRI